MEENEINKSNRIKIFVLVMLTLLVSVAGISYAYFTIQITGNDTASSMRLRTANMQLVYNDVQIVSGEYATPGWSDDKTLTVTNTGNVTAYYTIIWRDLINEVINNELVIYAECSSSSGTCDDIDETVVPTSFVEIHNAVVKGNISIAPGVTHTYTLTAEFIETGSNQNYNQNKYFNGTLNLAEGFEPVMRRNGTEPLTGLSMVKIGTEEFYDITSEINYTNLINTNGNIYNYESGKSVLLSKYNLYVGRIYDHGYTEISSSSSGYGLQNASATASYYDDTSIGIVPFCGSSNNYGYWDPNNSGINSKYGAYEGYSPNNIYDANYVAAPNYSVAFQNNAGNANYSIAYYVEEYVRRLGINGTGRLLTYSELTSGMSNIETGGSSYWLGTAISSTDALMLEYTNFAIGNVAFYQPYVAGVRPVIVVNTSDIQSS